MTSDIIVIILASTIFGLVIYKLTKDGYFKESD